MKRFLFINLSEVKKNDFNWLSPQVEFWNRLERAFYGHEQTDIQHLICVQFNQVVELTQHFLRCLDLGADRVQMGAVNQAHQLQI